MGIDPRDINGIFITHEHCDHTNGVRVFASRNKTPVFACAACMDEMLGKGLVTEDLCLNTISRHIELYGIDIQSFLQSHDSVECLGYRFSLPNGKSASVCTDTGYITDNAKEICRGSDLIFIESNHETSMVEAGSYPYPLKQRILGERGHLSNFACSEYIKELAQQGTTRFVLSHLSRENNTPDIARQTALSALYEVGLQENVDFRLYVSSSETTSQVIAL